MLEKIINDQDIDKKKLAHSVRDMYAALGIFLTGPDEDIANEFLHVIGQMDLHYQDYLKKNENRTCKKRY